MRKCRAVLLTSLVCGAFFGVPEVAVGAINPQNNTWIHINKNYDGIVTNVAHWGLDHFPVAGERLYFNSISTNFTVSFPDGVGITNAANCYFNAANGYTAVLSGSNSQWVMSGSPDATEVHNNDPFRVLGAGYGLLGLSLATVAAYTNDVAELSNFCFRVYGSTAAPRLIVDGGSYNFRNPRGTTVYDAVADAKRPILHVGMSYGATESSDVLFKNGASVKAWNFGLQASAPMNTVTFDGSTGYFETLNMPNGSIDYANNTSTRSDLVLTNGAKVFVNNSVLFGHRANKDVRMLLTGSDTELDVRGSFVGAQTSYNSVLELNDDATLKVGANFKITPGVGTNYMNIAGGNLIFGGDVAEFGCASAENRPMQFCRLTATGGSVRGVKSPFTMKVDGNTSVWTSNTTWNVWDMYLGNAGNGGRPVFEMRGGDVSISNNLFVGVKDLSNFTVSGGNLTVYQYIYVGSEAGSTGVFSTVAGVVSNNFTVAESPSKNASTVYVANKAGSYGEFNVSGGEVHLYSLFAAWYSHSKVNISGGRLTLRGDLRLGNGRTADDIEDVMTVSGGEVECNFGGTAEIGEASPSRARLKLTGGVFISCGLQGGAAAAVNGGSGWAVLECDGGAIAVKKSCSAIAKFDEAVINSGGLTIDTRGFDVTIDQDLKGGGVLTLTGGGKVTFAQGVTCDVVVKAVGGTRVDFNGVSPSGLILGDAENGAGVLAVTAGKTLTVAGDVVLNDFVLDNAGEMEKDVDYAPIIICKGKFDSSSKMKWEDAILNDSVVADVTEVFSWIESEVDTSLSVKIVDKVVNKIEVKEGVSNVTWGVSTRRTENLEVAVSNGAVCAVSGTLAKGRLVKTGEGRLELSGADNEFVGGFDFLGGLLKIVSPGAFGGGGSAVPSTFASGTFEVAASAGAVTLSNPSTLVPAPAANGATIFKTEGDLTMPLPMADMAGAVIKRGAGRLTFVCDWNGAKTLKWSSGYPSESMGGGKFSFPKNPKSVDFDDDWGSLPENVQYGIFNIVEGELVIRGTGDKTKIDFPVGPAFVGYPSSDTSKVREAQPTLVLDNVHCYFTSSHFHCGDSFAGANPWVVEPMVVVTNGATIDANTLLLTDLNCDNVNCSPLLYANGGRVSAYYRFEPHQSNHPNVVPRGVFIDSVLNTPQTELRKPDKMWFTNSVAEGKNSGEFMKMRILEDNYLHDWRFSSGSVLRFGELILDNSVTPSGELKLTFDDSQWIPGSGNLSFSTNRDSAAMDIVSEGVGLVLQPPQGEEWTFDIPLRGDGGFVKRGAGTVVFPGAYAGHKGRTVVEDGVLDLNGSEWVYGSFGGGNGVVSGGVLRNARVSLDVTDDGQTWKTETTPCFSGCTFTGRTRVDLGRTAQDPLSLPYRSLVVARYCGEAPDVSRWRLVGTGIKRTKGVFSADNGVVSVRADVADSLVITIR